MANKIIFRTTHTDLELKMFGIYGIVNNISNKTYIGSVTSKSSFRERWANHRLDLIKNKHSNYHLQNSWNKYGCNNFEFLILESCQSDVDLLAREQYYIDTTNNKYNICLIAGNTLGIKQTEDCILKKSKRWVFVSPLDEIYEVINMRRFCREHQLPQSHMINIAYRKSNHYKQWLSYTQEEFSMDLLRQDRQRLEKKKFELTSPEGKVIIVDNLHKFCKENVLDQPCLLNCLTKRCGRTQHKGWTIKEIDKVPRSSTMDLL